MHRIVNDEALDTLFRTAGTHQAWLARQVSDTMVRALWELVRLAPIIGGTGPTRVVFAKSDEAKARLDAAVPADRRAVLRSAPIVAIVGCSAQTGLSAAEGTREGLLLAAYLILAARALGLDCGPLWDFDTPEVDAAFFPDGSAASVFLCALGYGDETQVAPNQPRPGFAEACNIL